MSAANPEDTTGASGESAAASAASSAPSSAKELQEEEWKTELARLEYEIQTLRSVLAVKMREANELKRKLGITTISEFKDDLRHGMQTVRESDVYQKTNAALQNFGDYASKKIGAIRNSTMYKSFEEKVGGAYTSVKTRVSSSRSENDLGETGAELPSSDAAGTLPEDKVPL